MTDAPDLKDTVFLPKTDFPMKAGLPQKEPGILVRWESERLYQKLRAARAGREKFILHDGPPYANGDIHVGHALNHILKDMVVRTQSLMGKDAPYVPGWDCHGLPIEWKVEEQYRKKKLDKDAVPPAEFRAECRAYAQHWVNVQREQLKRLGINADWNNPYLTMDFDAEATIVAELLKFAESGQLYRGAKPVMWSPVEKTALAEAEVEYEDITSTQIDVAFEITESPIPELVGAHAVIWTTTPWTIPVNQALAYGPDVEYVLVELDRVMLIPTSERGTPPPLRDNSLDKKVLIAAPLVDAFRSRVETGFDNRWHVGSVLWRGKGSDLDGTVARHPMHHLGGFYAAPRPLLPGNLVTTDSGTGLVHMAPDHGEDDFDLCKAHGLNPVFAVEGDGKYRADWIWLGGQGSVINPKFNAPDGPICSDLRESGALLAASADYKHSYPHSWRSKAKLIYRCTPQWFVPMDRPIASEPHKTVRAEPVEALSLSEAGNQGSPSTSSGPAALGHGKGVSATLRQLALGAIADTQFFPEKGRNRIGSMVEGRPDWVLSRQRAWGVPITLFVHRKSGEYLVDSAVNDRIVAAVREGGVDAWCDERAQEYLGDGYAAADYERVADILDVWFDSGCTHAFVLESGRWPELSWPANLYLEGSDQHRGWFQSSLLQSCATRGRAPYEQVLTHGFTMDSKGMKMSKSLGNTVDPIKVMESYGADIIRLWALSVDFTEDHRIGEEILKGVADQYRKIRNTFRYMLGALEGFSEEERVSDVAAMPELERYMLHSLAQLDATLKTAAKTYDFNTYVRALADFCNDDLSAFFFDIRKDSLYCDVGPAVPLGTDKRRAYRSVLDTLFEALVRYAAPVLVFTAEEVWGTRYPEGGSVHLLEWREVPADWIDGDLAARWDGVRAQREAVTEAIEPFRREKTIRSSLEAEVAVSAPALPIAELEEVFIVSAVREGDSLTVTRTTNHKCGRCWRHLPDVAEDGALCGRCADVLG